MEFGRLCRPGRSFSIRTGSVHPRPALIVLTPTTRERVDWEFEERRHSEERRKPYQKSYGPCGWTKGVRALAPSRDLSQKRSRPRLLEVTSLVRVREVLVADFLLQESAKLGDKQRKLGKELKEQILTGQGKATTHVHKRALVHIQLPRLLLSEPLMC